MNARIGYAIVLTAGVTACAGQQSVLDTAGREAEQLAGLFWVLLAGAVLLWLLLNGLFFYTTRLNPRPLSRRLAEGLIFGGGVAFPTVVLAAVLGYGLSIMPEQRAPGTGLTVRVTAEQWWWRVEYLPEDGSAAITSANEIRLPLDARTEIELGADRVIHSFWIPALAGKTDMFPGRQTRMALEPTEAGTFRGQCAEFCGASHALMAFQAVVMPPDDFAAWLAHERGPAVEPVDARAERGREVFMAEGCGACHAIRGTVASGKLGPDLTHVGSRQSLGAGILPPTTEAFARWIGHTEAIKPEVAMPSYATLGDDDLSDLAHYLKGLN